MEIKNRHFIKIIDENILYVGGDQQWYKDNELGVEGGCGPTTAANMLTQLAISNPKFDRLYLYDIGPITKEDFTKHMEEVIEHLIPIKLPTIIAGKKLFYFKMPITLGVPTVRRFIKGIKRFGVSRAVKIKVIPFNQPKNFENAETYIKKALEKDRPIALLNYWNSKLKTVPFIDANNIESQVDIQMHWVTIFAMDEDKKTGEITIKVSTWGGIALLNLKDVINSYGFGGMAYLE